MPVVELDNLQMFLSWNGWLIYWFLNVHQMSIIYAHRIDWKVAWINILSSTSHLCFQYKNKRCIICSELFLHLPHCDVCKYYSLTTLPCNVVAITFRSAHSLLRIVHNCCKTIENLRKYKVVFSEREVFVARKGKCTTVVTECCSPPCMTNALHGYWVKYLCAFLHVKRCTSILTL